MIVSKVSGAPVSKEINNPFLTVADTIEPRSHYYSSFYQWPRESEGLNNNIRVKSPTLSTCSNTDSRYESLSSWSRPHNHNTEAAMSSHSCDFNSHGSKNAPGISDHSSRYTVPQSPSFASYSGFNFSS